jgi:hypothetical protein
VRAGRLEEEAQRTLGRAVRLGYVAARCIEVMPEARCIVANVLPELDAITGRKAIRCAERGEEYDPMMGELVGVTAVLPDNIHSHSNLFCWNASLISYRSPLRHTHLTLTLHHMAHLTLTRQGCPC